MQDQPPAKRVVGCALTGSEGTVQAVSVSSSAPVVSGGAVAAERSPPVCEGELCGVSSPLVHTYIGSVTSGRKISSSPYHALPSTNLDGLLSAVPKDAVWVNLFSPHAMS